MAVQVDVRVSAEALMRAAGERYTRIISDLVRENALLSASLDQVTARCEELEAQIAAEADEPTGGGTTNEA